MPTSQKNREGLIFAVCAAFGLGAITTQAKFVYANGGDAMTVMFVRFLCSVILIGGFILLSGFKFSIPRSKFWGVLAIGLIWSGAMISYLASVERISVSLAVILLYTYPLFVLLFSVLGRSLTLTPVRILFFVVAFVGLCLALSDGALVFDQVGILLAVGAGLGAATTFILGAKLTAEVHSVTLTFWINTVGLLMILPFVMDNSAFPSGAFAWTMLGGATLCYVVAILCQFRALTLMPAAAAAFVFNLEPLVSLLLATLVLGEILTTTQWTGVALVLGSLLFNSWDEHRQSSVSS